MNLKREFNFAIEAYRKATGKSIGKVTEPQLVKILVDVLNGQCNISSKMYHQKYVNFCYAGKQMRRELCDTLLIVKHKSYFRVSFVQNKKKINRYSGLGSFEINCGQHYLLQKKPPFTPTTGSGIMPAVAHFVNNSVYDTVTTYSVFYTDCKGNIDLDLASACSVICKKKMTPYCVRCTYSANGTCGVKYSSACHLHSKINFNSENSIIDYDSHVTLDEIEMNSEFGEVIAFKDFGAKLGGLISFFNSDGSAYDFFKIPKNIEMYNNTFQMSSDKYDNNDVYYYIPKMVLINMGNDEKLE